VGGRCALVDDTATVLALYMDDDVPSSQPWDVASVLNPRGNGCYDICFRGSRSESDKWVQAALLGVEGSLTKRLCRRAGHKKIMRP
jgi:hypothetical protein